MSMDRGQAIRTCSLFNRLQLYHHRVVSLKCQNMKPPYATGYVAAQFQPRGRLMTSGKAFT